jgi:hypothetical protein
MHLENMLSYSQYWIAAVEKKENGRNFCAKYTTARVEGVIMVRGAVKKYRGKWNDLMGEHEYYCTADHKIPKN